MSRDFEIFSPVLYAFALESSAKAPAAGGEQTPQAALFANVDVKAAALKACLRDLDGAKFSGHAREELAMATRKFEQGATGFGPAKTGKLAVMTAPWQGFRAGSLAYVQQTDAGIIAYLTKGTRVSEADGVALLERRVVSAERHKPLAKVMAVNPFHPDADELTTMFKMAELAKPFLPGPAGQAVDLARGLIDLFSGDSPSEGQLIVEAIQTAIDAAVAKIENYIASEKTKDINAIINSAYNWLHGAAVQTNAAVTLERQVVYAHRAIAEMQPHIKALYDNLERLTTVSVSGDVRGDLHARRTALKLLSHGAIALFSLRRLYMQFDAFLARTCAETGSAHGHKALAEIDFTALKTDVVGDDRAVIGDDSDLVEGSFLRTFDLMRKDLVRDRVACTSITRVNFGNILDRVIVKDAYMGDYVADYERWALNFGPEIQGDFAKQVEMTTAGFAYGINWDGAFPDRWEALNSFRKALPGWTTTFEGWQVTFPADASKTQAAE